jgi:sulfate adenylyltransferase subunit 2
MQITTTISNPVNPTFDHEHVAVWGTELAFAHLSQLGLADTKRTAERRLHALRLVPAALTPSSLLDELGRKPVQAVLNWEIAQARSQRKLVLFSQLHTCPDVRCSLHANDARGGRYWVPLPQGVPVTPMHVLNALQQIQAHLGKDIVVFPHGDLVKLCRESNGSALFSLLAYPSVLFTGEVASTAKRAMASTSYLKQLEAESTHIIREAVAEANNPVMLYSVGKDSGRHAAPGAVRPSTRRKPPFPLLHVDTALESSATCMRCAETSWPAELRHGPAGVAPTPRPRREKHQPLRPRLGAAHRHHQDCKA